MIERRNELAERVNQLTGDSLDMPKLPVRGGYVMDWYMAQKHEWEKTVSNLACTIRIM